MEKDNFFLKGSIKYKKFNKKKGVFLEDQAMKIRKKMASKRINPLWHNIRKIVFENVTEAEIKPPTVKTIIQRISFFQTNIDAHEEFEGLK